MNKRDKELVVKVDCIFQEGSYPCYPAKEPDCELCRRVCKAERERVCKTYDKYVKALENENSALVGFAHTHGWRSSQVEFGKRCREEIQALKGEDNG